MLNMTLISHCPSMRVTPEVFLTTSLTIRWSVMYAIHTVRLVECQ